MQYKVFQTIRHPQNWSLSSKWQNSILPSCNIIQFLHLSMQQHHTFKNGVCVVKTCYCFHNLLSWVPKTCGSISHLWQTIFAHTIIRTSLKQLRIKSFFPYAKLNKCSIIFEWIRYKDKISIQFFHPANTFEFI